MNDTLLAFSDKANGDRYEVVTELGKESGVGRVYLARRLVYLPGLEDPVETAVALIGREYEVARTTEASVERALGQSKADIQSLNRKEFQLGVLEREVAQNRNLYDQFVNHQDVLPYRILLTNPK